MSAAMARMDTQIRSAQTRLAAVHFVHALAWGMLAVAAAACLAISAERLMNWELPGLGWYWLAGAAGLATVAAGVWAIARRPTPLDAAVQIDERLNLKERFSTALFARGLKGDPFAAETVRAAEDSAAGVRLTGKFPLPMPSAAWWAIGAACVGLILWAWLPTRQRSPASAALAIASPQTADAVKRTRDAAQTAIERVEALPPDIADDADVQLAKKELESILARPDQDPTQLHRKAMEAQKQLEKAIGERVRQNQRFAQADNARRAMQSVATPTEQTGAVADVQRAIANGDFAAASEQLNRAVRQFQDGTPQEQRKAAEQMQQLADTLGELANDPAADQRMKQQIKQLGADDQQAERMAGQLTKAAAGDSQAAAELGKSRAELQQQMNNGLGPTPSQQTRFDQLTSQLQGMASTQAGIQSLQQSASRMATAMRQAAPGPTPPAQPGQPLANTQPGSQQSGQPQPGQPQAGQPQANQANAGQPQPGQQPSAQSQPSQANAGQPQPGQQQPGQPQANQSNTAQPQPGQPQANQSNTAQPQPGQPQASPSAAGQQPSGQPQSPQANAGEPQKGQSGSPQPQSGQQPSGPPQPSQSAQASADGPPDSPSPDSPSADSAAEMAAAAEQMQEQLKQMEQVDKDMQTALAAQAAAQQGAQAAGQGLDVQNRSPSGSDGESPAAGASPGGGPGSGDASTPGQGQGGMASGDRSFKTPAPFGTRAELSPSQEDEKGKVLSSTFVKAGSIRGESRAELAETAAAAQQQAADEVDSQRVTGQARQVLRDYFNAVAKEPE